MHPCAEGHLSGMTMLTERAIARTRVTIALSFPKAEEGVSSSIEEDDAELNRLENDSEPATQATELTSASDVALELTNSTCADVTVLKDDDSTDWWTESGFTQAMFASRKVDPSVTDAGQEDPVDVA